jgi:hypothetical protein
MRPREPRADAGARPPASARDGGWKAYNAGRRHAIHFEASWLDLREAFDTAARSFALADRFAVAMPARPHLIDLGAGSGSMFRWLAPIIGRPQSWLLVDADPDLIARAYIKTEFWATAHGWTVTRPSRSAQLVHTPQGAWRMEALLADLADPAALPWHGIDGVVCSALLDLVSAAWLERLVGLLRGPMLACLSVDGRDRFAPPHPLDAAVRTGFRRDQLRDKGFGPALGPRAPAVLHAALAARGFTVASALSDWCVPASALVMLRELVPTHAEAAARWRPAQRSAIAAWENRRVRQAIAGRLAIRIGHRDSLALPPR